MHEMTSEEYRGILDQARTASLATVRADGRPDVVAEDYGRRNAVPGEVLVRVMPEKIVARKNIAE